MQKCALLLLITWATVTAQEPREGRTPSGIAYDVQGRGPAVVLISGSNLDRRLWAREVEWLTASHTVIRYDLRAHGRSATPTEPFSHLSDLEAVLDQLEIERVSLVGLSAGAAIALTYALENPARVDRVVLASPVISGYVPQQRPPFPPELMAALKAADYPAASQILLKLPTFAAPPESAALVRQMITENERLWTVRRELMQPLPPAAGRLDELKVPALVLAGEDDAPSREQAEVIGRHAERARVVIVPGGGHLLNLTSRQAFRTAVEPFLREAAPSPRGVVGPRREARATSGRPPGGRGDW